MAGVSAGTGHERSREAGTLLRGILDEMGGLWVKLGQLLASSGSEYPSAFRNELRALHDRSSGFPPAIARRIVEEALGRPIERLFREFEDQPFAAGSTAQVHRAVLRDEDVAVVVKVQRPDVDATFRRDLVHLRRLTRFASRFRRFAWLRLGEMEAKLRAAIESELDFRREGAQLRALREEVRSHGVHVPRTWRRWSTRRVLVMERLEGVPASTVVAAWERDRARVEAWFEENRIDPRKVARRLNETILRQIFEQPRFHGDPNPANVLLLRGGRLALIDAGAVGRLDEEYQRTYVRFLLYVASREYNDAVVWYIRLFQPVPPVDLNQLQRKLAQVFKAWDARTQTRSLPYDSRSLVSLLDRMGRLVSAFRLPPNWSNGRVDLTLLALDRFLSHFDPKMDCHEEVERYLLGARRRKRSIWSAEGLPPGYDLPQLAQRFVDMGSDFESMARQGASRFGTTNTRLSSALEIVLAKGRRAASLALALLVLAFAVTWIGGSAGPRVPLEIDGIARWFARLALLDWAILGVALLHARRFLGRLERRMAVSESRRTGVFE